MERSAGRPRRRSMTVEKAGAYFLNPNTLANLPGCFSFPPSASSSILEVVERRSRFPWLDDLRPLCSLRSLWCPPPAPVLDPPDTLRRSSGPSAPALAEAGCATRDGVDRPGAKSDEERGESIPLASGGPEALLCPGGPTASRVSLAPANEGCCACERDLRTSLLCAGPR